LILIFALGQASFDAGAQEQSELQPLKTKLDQLVASKNYIDAVPVAESIVAVIEETQLDSLELTTALEALAEIYEKADRSGDVEPVLKRIIAIRERLLGGQHPDLAKPLEALADHLNASGRQEDAADAYSRVLEIRERTLPPENPEVIALLEKLGHYYAVSGRPTDAEFVLQRLVLARDKLPASVERAMVHEQLAQVYIDMLDERTADVEQHLKQAIDIRTSLDAKDPHLPELLELLANVYGENNRHAEAEPFLKRSIALREARAVLEEQGSLVRALRSLAGYYVSAGRTADAEDALKRALALIELPDSPVRMDFDILRRLADVYFATDRLELAEGLYRRAWSFHVSDITSEKPPEPTALADILEEYSVALSGKDRLLYLTRALELRDDEVAASNPNVIALLEKVAASHLAASDGDGSALAEPYFKHAIAIRESAFGPKNLDLADSLEEFATSYPATEFAKAEPLYQRALNIREAPEQPANDDLVTALEDLATKYLEMDRFADAEPLFVRALAVRTRLAGGDGPTLITPLRRLATTYIDHAQFDSALPLFERVMALREKQIGANDPRLADLLDEIGEQYRNKNKPDEAVRSFNRAIDIRLSVFGADRRYLGKSVKRLTEYLKSLGRAEEAAAEANRLSGDTARQNVFYIFPPGELQEEGVKGVAEYQGYAPGMRFPVGTYPATLNSQIYGFGGYQKGGGSQCDEENYNELWWDNYCESRMGSGRRSLCSIPGVHQGVDVRGGTQVICKRTVKDKQSNLVPIVAVYDGIITQIGRSGTLQLKTDNGHIFKYLHADLAPELTEVKAGSRVSAGQVIGYVSDVMGAGAGTTLHLHFEHWMEIEGLGNVPVPLYCDLVLAYERDRGKRHEVIGGGRRCGDSGVTVAMPHEIVSELKPGMSVKINGSSMSVSEIKADQKTVTLLGGSGAFQDGLNSLISDAKQFNIWKEKDNFSKFPEPYASSYAIIAAIDDYDRKKDPENRGPSGFRELTDMVARAEQLKAELIKTGFPEANITTLYDEEATSMALDNALGEFHEGGKYAGADRLLFYFGGHGGGAAKSGYLVTYDFDKARPTRKGFMMSRFVSEHFPNIKAKHVLVTLDACSSGLAVPGMDALSGTPESTDAERFATLATIRAETNEKARNMLVASTGEQPARVEAGGIFTRALIEGLDGKADVIKDGVIQFTELRLYVERRVRAWAAELGVSQEPRSFEATREGNGKVLFMLPSRSQ
jgi:tetratricopeptide (TPR) repeat protein